MEKYRYILILICINIYPFTAFSQETDIQALSNIEIRYTYSDGASVILTIKNGKLGYRWTAGIAEGSEVNELTYYSKELADSIYLVSWHDSENKNFVTLIFDFNLMVEHGTAIIFYATPYERTLFDEAIINKVSRL
jgi:phenolic acid decarboxylase